MSELKPCPFCGKALEERRSPRNPRARCRTEGCKGEQLPVLNLDDIQDIAAWITRAAAHGGGKAMSGGHFDYRQFKLGYIADEIERQIDNPDFAFSDKTKDVFRDAIKRLREAEVIVHRIDYLISCDDGEAEFHQQLQDDLRAMMPRDG